MSQKKWITARNTNRVARRKYGLGGDIFGGAASGATTGSMAGPWGAAAGAVVGGAAGLIGGKRKEKAEAIANRRQEKATDVSRAFADYVPTGQSYNAMFKNGGTAKSTDYSNVNMKSLWATAAKKDPNATIGSLDPTDKKFKNGFTLKDAMNFPQDVKDKYNIDAMGTKILGTPDRQLPKGGQRKFGSQEEALKYNKAQGMGRPSIYDKQRGAATSLMDDGTLKTVNSSEDAFLRGNAATNRDAIGEDYEYAYGGEVPMYAMGGQVPIEAEGGESGVAPTGMPGGEDFNIEGASHAQGGVDMEVPDGTQIFSDRLKPAGSKKTFSDLNKSLSSRMKRYQDTVKNPDSTGISKSTAERMLKKMKGEQQSLFVDQERLKQPKGGLNSKYKFADGGFAGSNELTAGMQALPALYNIGQGLFGKADTIDAADYDNYEGRAAANRVASQKYDISNQLANNRQSTRVGKHNIQGAARTRGEMLSGMGGLSAQRMAADSNLYSQKRNMENQYSSQGAQMQSAIGSQAAQTRRSVDDYNAQAQAAQSNYLQAGMSQLSGVGQQYQKNSNMQGQDDMKMQLLMEMFPNFQMPGQRQQMQVPAAMQRKGLGTNYNINTQLRGI